MRVFVVALCAIALAGCEVGGTVGAGSQQLDTAALEAQRVAVARVERVELGRTATGVALAAFGAAPGRGWSVPVLSPRGRGPDAEGMLAFDLRAIPPQDAGAGEDALRADLVLHRQVLTGVRGFRVHGAQNSAEFRFR